MSYEYEIETARKQAKFVSSLMVACLIFLVILISLVSLPFKPENTNVRMKEIQVAWNAGGGKNTERFLTACMKKLSAKMSDFEISTTLLDNAALCERKAIKFSMFRTQIGQKQPENTPTLPELKAAAQKREETKAGKFRFF